MRTGLLLAALGLLLGGCAPGYAGDPGPVSVHMGGRYVAVGGVVSNR